jgi:ABC-type bacteriocin/lantibiotic exporter with double-glycine peptidase domain
MAEARPGTLTPFQRVARLLGQYRMEMRYIFIYAFVIGLINLSLPLGIQAIIGLIAGGAISASWGVMILFVVIGAMFVGMLRYFQLNVTEHIQRRIFADSAVDFAVRIPRLNLEDLRKEYIPELVNRFFDTLTIQKGLPKVLIDGSTALLQIVISLLFLSFYHSTFVSSSLILLLVLVLFFYFTTPLGLKTSLLESKYKYKLVYWLEEVGRVAPTFKLVGNNRFPLTRADEHASNYLSARADHWRILVVQFLSSVAFRVLVLGGFLVLGSLLVMNNELNLGQFVASEILILFVVDSVEKLINLHEIGYDILTAVEKIGQVTDLPLEREDGLSVDEFCSNEPLSVELRNLSYQNADYDSPILNDINLKINAGERVAIAGYSGSGKSTLMQILSVLKRNFTGILLFNGLPKSNINLRSLRSVIGDLSSQEDIFKGSVLENITINQQGIMLPDVLKIIDAIGLGEYIRKMPEGVNTELLPGGVNLPRSIVNKILVARAVVGKPKILSMENPLQNLNYRDRLRISHYLTDRSHQWTLCCVAEDALFASMCDRVVVLKDGVIVFDGSFDEVQKTAHFDFVFRVERDFTMSQEEFM